jgi:outer membrane protein
MKRLPSCYRAVIPIVLLTGACSTSPFEQSADSDLRNSVVEAAQRELAAAETAPEDRTLTRQPKQLEFPPDRMEELEEMAGWQSHGQIQPEDLGPELLGPDLLGRAGLETPIFRITLEQAVEATVRNNLSVQIARIDPAILQSQVIAAEAAFDWVFFTNFDWNNNDQPSPITLINGQPIGVGARSSQSVSWDTGVRKSLTSGGSFSVSAGQVYTDDTTPGIELDPDPSNAAVLNLGYQQPLLRGFGSDVALSEIRLARNAERDAIHALEQALLDVVTDTENAYWSLFQARHSLQIRLTLLKRGIETRDVLESRLGVDARPAEYSDAVARVESRRSDVIRSINDLRQRSDALKLLINDPQLNVGTEILLLPLDQPVDAPITYSLLESISTAMTQRPEIKRAILGIDDASIRQTVARNARLPLLNFSMDTTFQGLDRDIGRAANDVAEGRFIGWLMALAFEQPIGNRAGEANFRAAQLSRLSATINYRRTIQQLVLDVKATLRNVETNYRLIQQTRTSRLAAAENLRTLLVLERTIAALTPDFLNLKLNRQEALAVAELEELQAIVDYNVSLANLNRATGTALERNGVRMVVPDAPDEVSEPE